MKRRLLLCLGLIVSTASQAMDNSGIWASSTLQTDFGGSNYLAFLEAQPRSKNDNNDFSQLIVRPFVGYKVSKQLQLWLGFAWQGEYDDKNGFDLATKDIVEQVQWIDNLTPQLNVQYRFRLEQRFFEDADLSHRMRHRFRLQYSIPNSKLFLVAFDELFVYFNSLNNSRLEHSVQAGVNQNRSYFGVGYKIMPEVNMDVGYQLQYVNNFGTEDVYNHVWLTNLNINF
ncbi:MAG: DUF2490 domain-containing protein [Methylococcaceae bacterium]